MEGKERFEVLDSRPYISWMVSFSTHSFPVLYLRWFIYLCLAPSATFFVVYVFRLFIICLLLNEILCLFHIVRLWSRFIKESLYFHCSRKRFIYFIFFDSLTYFLFWPLYSIIPFFRTQSSRLFSLTYILLFIFVIFILMVIVVVLHLILDKNFSQSSYHIFERNF